MKASTGKMPHTDHWLVSHHSRGGKESICSELISSEGDCIEELPAVARRKSHGLEDRTNDEGNRLNALNNRIGPLHTHAFVGTRP